VSPAPCFISSPSNSSAHYTSALDEFVLFQLGLEPLVGIRSRNPSVRVLHPFFILDIWNDAYRFLRKHLSLIEFWVLVIIARSSSARDRRVASSSCIDDRYHNSPRAIFGSIEVLAGRKIRCTAAK